MASEEEEQNDETTTEFRKPLWICQMICDHPKISFGVTLSLHLVMVLATVIMITSGYDIIPFKLEQLPLFLESHVDYDRGMAWKNRDADTDIIDPTNFDGAALTPRTKTNSFVQLYFDAGTDGNMFTQENLLLMKQAQDQLFTAKFQNEFCFRIRIGVNTFTCAKPASVLRFFDGTYTSVNAVFNDPNFDNINGVLNAANGIPTLRAQLREYLGIDAVVSAAEVRTSITRMTMLFGGPFPGYHNMTDRKTEQDEMIEEYVLSEIKPLITEWYNIGLGPDVVVYTFHSDLISDYIVRQVIIDNSLAIGSMVFIIGFLVFQTRSWWIAGFGVLSIITSFTWANAIYRIVLDIRFFGTFHILSIFIILGIGADDFFVFLDTWKLSQYVRYPTLAHRLSAVYRKACAAMLFTSLTTAVAFFISGTSPLLAINSFGIFSGILVVVNYLSVITFFPCVVITQHLYWSGPCCRGGCCGRPPIAPDAVHCPTKKNLVVRFFANTYYNFVTSRVGRIISLVVSLAVIIFFGIYAAQLKPNEEETQFLPPSTNIGKYLEASTTRFLPSDADQKLANYIVWGIKTQDRSSCHKSDYKCTGETIWDDDFNLNVAQAQTDLLNFCQKLKTGLTNEQIADLKIKRNEITNDLEVACFIDDLDAWMQVEETNTTRYTSGGTLALPTSVATMKNNLMTHNPNLYDMATLSPSYNRWFEIGLQHWLFSAYNASSMLNSEQFKRFASLVGSSLDTYNYPVVTQPFPGGDVRYGTRLRYAAIQVNTTLLVRKLAFMEGLPIRDRWESFVTSELAQMSEPLQKGFMTSTASFTGSVWHWMQVQKVLVQSAVSGVIIGVCVAFPILLIATDNFIVALFATVVIGLVTVSVMGTLPLAGWSLGTLESLNLVLVVGLAVDYVVHLAEGYCRSKERDRLSRVRNMLEEVGISVLSGACTTLGASFFLFMAVITFFMQFGVFMFATIGFSLFYSLVLFVTTLTLIGPEGDFGSASLLWKRLVSKMRGEKKRSL